MKCFWLEIRSNLGFLRFVRICRRTVSAHGAERARALLQSNEFCQARTLSSRRRPYRNTRRRTGICFSLERQGEGLPSLRGSSESQGPPPLRRGGSGRGAKAAVPSGAVPPEKAFLFSPGRREGGEGAATVTGARHRHDPSHDPRGRSPRPRPPPAGGGGPPVIIELLSVPVPGPRAYRVRPVRGPGRGAGRSVSLGLSTPRPASRRP